MTSTNAGSPTRYDGIADVRDYIMEEDTAAAVTPTVIDYSSMPEAATLARSSSFHGAGALSSMMEYFSAGLPSSPSSDGKSQKRERPVYRVGKRRATFESPAAKSLRDAPMSSSGWPPPEAGVAKAALRRSDLDPGHGVASWSEFLADESQLAQQPQHDALRVSRMQHRQAPALRQPADNDGGGDAGTVTTGFTQGSWTTNSTATSQGSMASAMSINSLLVPVGIQLAVSDLEYIGMTMPCPPEGSSPGFLSPTRWPSILKTRILQIRPEDYVGRGKNAVVLAVRRRARVLRHLATIRPSVLQRRRVRASSEQSAGSDVVTETASFVWKVVLWNVAVQPSWRRLDRRWWKAFGPVMECTPFLTEVLVHLLLMQEVYHYCPHIMPLRLAVAQPKFGIAGLLLDRMDGSVVQLGHKLSAEEWDTVLLQALMTLLVAQERVQLKHHDAHMDNWFLGPPPPDVPLDTTHVWYRVQRHVYDKDGRLVKSLPVWFRRPMPRYWLYLGDFGFSSATDPVTGYRIGRSDLCPRQPLPARYRRTGPILAGSGPDPAEPVWTRDSRTAEWHTQAEWGPFDYNFDSGYDLHFMMVCLWDLMKRNADIVAVRKKRLKRMMRAVLTKGTKTSSLKLRPRAGAVSTATPRQVLFASFEDCVQRRGPPTDPRHYCVVHEPIPPGMGGSGHGDDG
jgi:hypothetical protein